MRKSIYINGRQGKLEYILFEPDERNAGKGSFLFLPGVPGTDKNDDLAQMLCFDGYRGFSGQPRFIPIGSLLRAADQYSDLGFSASSVRPFCGS